jgi:hypothetical protein
VAETDDIAPGIEPPSPSDAALSSLAKSEDVTSYVETRREDEGLEPEAAPEDRQSRIDEALARARQDTARAREQSDGLDGELQRTEAEYQQQQWQEAQAQQQWQQQLDYARQAGHTRARAEQLRQSNPSLHEQITSNLMLLESVLDPAQQQALHASLAYHPDATWNMAVKLTDGIEYEGCGATLSDKVDVFRRASPEAIWQAARQGAQQLQAEAYVQARILQDRLTNGRRISNAPLPMSTPRGGAGPPRDLHRLAEKENASDYIRARMAQEKRREG